MDVKITERIKALGSRLLVADDDPVIREQLVQIGESLGFEVHAAEDGEDAWEIFKMVWPELAILDIYMPRMNGLLLMNKIKEANEDALVVLITGYLHFQRVVQKNQIKPDGFIIKPFSMEVIVKEVTQLMTEYVLVD